MFGWWVEIAEAGERRVVRGGESDGDKWGEATEEHNEG